MLSPSGSPPSQSAETGKILWSEGEARDNRDEDERLEVPVDDGSAVRESREHEDGPPPRP